MHLVKELGTNFYGSKYLMTFRKVFPKRILISESKVQNSKFELAFIYTSLEVYWANIIIHLLFK